MARGKSSIRGIIEIDGVKYEAKTCTLCVEMKTLDDYGVQSNTKDKRKSRCKLCLAELSRKYNKTNPEKRRISESNWRNRNPKKVKEMSKRSRNIHKDAYKKRLEKWKELNTERNKALKRAHTQNRRALEKSLINDYTATESEFKRLLYNGCALSDNTEDLHDDHFIALSTGHCGTYLANIIPLSSELNLSKCNKNPFEWLNEVDDVIDYKKAAETIIMLAYLNEMTVQEYIDFVYWCYENPRSPEEVKDKVNSIEMWRQSKTEGGEINGAQSIKRGTL
jgi:hypothetical protein